MGSWSRFYGYKFNDHLGGNKGYQRTKREFNDQHTSAQKEKIYRSRLNVFNFLRRNSDKRDGNDDKSATIPVTDMENFSAAGGFGAILNTYNSYVYATEAFKEQKIAIYREMAKYPEISFAVDEYVNEGIDFDDEGRFIDMTIKSDALSENQNARKTIEAEWNNLIYDVIEADHYVSTWFKEFMIDAEIGLEKVIDMNKPERGVVKIKKLRTTRLHPIWDDLETDDIAQFVYKTENEAMFLDPEMVAYANSGEYEYTQEEDDKIVLGFLEPAKTTYKRLKQLEDAVVIYRLVRAPERRVFKIDVGQLPKGRAEQYLKDLMNKYRQRKFYDARSGEVSESLDVMAMTEDFWFPVYAGSNKSSEVSTLPGGEGLGEMGDIEYFLEKLFRSLKVPMSRFKSDTGFSIGDTSDITREEVKFIKEVRRYTSRFADIFKQVFLTHLDLKGIIEEFGISKSDIHVKIKKSNLFEEFLQAKVDEIKANRLSNVEGLIDTDEPILSTEYVMKNIYGMSDTEWEKNQEMIEKERAAKEAGSTQDEEEQF